MANDNTARGTRRKRTRNGVRERALAAGKKFYISDRPCRRGHRTRRRYTCNHMCVACAPLIRDRYRATAGYQAARRARYEVNYMNDPTRFIYDRARGRAQRKGLAFDLTHAYVKSLWPRDGCCPALGLRLKPNVGGHHQAPDSPSLDRFDTRRGYVRGNVAIISCRANQMKMDAATPDSLRRLADWLERVHAVIPGEAAFEALLRGER